MAGPERAHGFTMQRRRLCSEQFHPYTAAMYTGVVPFCVHRMWQPQAADHPHGQSTHTRAHTLAPWSPCSRLHRTVPAISMHPVCPCRADVGVAPS